MEHTYLPQHMHLHAHYSWVAPPVDAHEESFCQRNERAMYDKSETTYGKTSERGIQICWGLVLGDPFRPLFQNKCPNI